MNKAQAVLEKLDEIEREMREISFWDESLDLDDISSKAERIIREEKKSPVGSMPFEQWLQAIFIPNARSAAESSNLPASSQVSIMAIREYDYHSHTPEAQRLLGLLREFDALF